MTGLQPIGYPEGTCRTNAVAGHMRALIVLLLLTPLATASLAEDTTGADLQRDAGRFGDAGDNCNAPRALAFPVSTEGTLAPADDLRDFYVFDVPADRVGTLVELRLAATLDADLYVYDPGCATHLASSRSYAGEEEILFEPARPGGHVVKVLLFSPLADDVAPRAALAAYDISLR